MTLARSLQRKVAYTKGSDRYKLPTRKLAIFIGTSNSPVEDVALRDLLRAADQRCVAPSRTAISRGLESILFELKVKIGSYLQHVKKIHICTDIWPKKGLTSLYLGITGHFFSWKDHRRHCVMLAVCHTPPSHTADNIRSVVEEVLSEWDIPHATVSTTLTRRYWIEQLLMREHPMHSHI